MRADRDAIQRIPGNDGVWRDSRIREGDYAKDTRSWPARYLQESQVEKTSRRLPVSEPEMKRAGILVISGSTAWQELVARQRRDGSWDILRRVIEYGIFKPVLDEYLDLCETGLSREQALARLENYNRRAEDGVSAQPLAADGAA